MHLAVAFNVFFWDEVQWLDPLYETVIQFWLWSEARIPSFKRTRMACLKLGRLQPGTWRELTKKELRELLDFLDDRARSA